MKSPPLLRVEFAPSHLAALFVCVTCLATAALLAWLPTPRWARAACVVAVGAYALWLLRSWAMRNLARSITGIELSSDQHVALIERSGRRIEGHVRPDSYVGPWVTTLVMRPRGKRRSRAVAILPDMLPREDFRRLRVMLRFGQRPRERA